MKKILFLLLLVAALPVQAIDKDALQGADSWVYQLQDANIGDLASTDYDVIVMDYSKDGTDSEAYTRSQIKKLQDSGKIVLAYLSIGEAEDYRFYWQDDWENNPPEWLGPENKSWEGNYKVRYWQDDWWKTGIRPYLNRIEKAGFDGVYLDIIDAYDYWGQHGYKYTKSANRMVKLITKIRTNFNTPDKKIICPQNGESIVDDVSKKYRQQYWKNVNCLGVEDLFYHSSKSDRNYRKKILKKFTNQGITILNVEYIKKNKVEEYLNEVSQQDFNVIPYRAQPDRELDEY